MEYRNWSQNGARTSLLGFGCMRFPTNADGTIDEERAEALLNTAKAAGVNYFDTAYPYHNGQSEPFVGRVIAKWDRSSFYLATKMPLWKCKSLDDAKRIFEEQLQRLGVDYIDFYLLHSLHRARYEKAKAMGVVDWLWEQKAAGRIRNFGFSCHDNSAGFEFILRDQPWDFCQLQYNYLDRDDRAEEISGDRGYQLTEECGVPLVIMEPIKGGTLASLPADAAAPLHALRPDATDASWALRWVGSHKNVHVILSGMSAEDQLADNLSTFDRFEPLSPAENAAVESVADELHRRIKIGCTGCRYCMPCPMGVDIPDNFSIWNKLGMFGQKDAIKAQWPEHFPCAAASAKPSARRNFPSAIRWRSCKKNWMICKQKNSCTWVQEFFLFTMNLLPQPNDLNDALRLIAGQLQMVLQGVCRAVPVAGQSSVQNLQMFAAGLLLIDHAHFAGHDAEAGVQASDAVVGRAQILVGQGAHQQFVELIVRLAEVLDLVRVVHQLGVGFQLFARDAAAVGAQRIGLHQQAHLEHAVHVFLGDAGDHQALFGQDGDEPLLLQTAQSIPHGGAADVAHFRTELLLVQEFIGPVLAVQDPGLEVLVRLQLQAQFGLRLRFFHILHNSYSLFPLQ